MDNLFHNTGSAGFSETAAATVNSAPAGFGSAGFSETAAATEMSSSAGMEAGQDAPKNANIRNYFASMGLACLIYGILFTFCLYKNVEGVTVPLFVIATEVLILRAVKATGREFKKDSLFVMVLMTLIGSSSFLTGNFFTLFMNYCAEFLLTVTLLIHNFADDRDWDFGTYFGRIICCFFGAITYIGSPFADYGSFRTGHDKDNGKTRPIILGIVIAIPCLIIMGTLLSSADMVFSDFLGGCFDGLNFGSGFLIVFMTLFGILASYCGIRYIAGNVPDYGFKEAKKRQPVTAITVLAFMLVLYLIFSGIQVAYLFIGRLALPKGITYAQYARTGFFQLLAVCVIDLMSVLLIKKYTEQSRVLNIMLLGIIGCTYIMTASSAVRMLMYIGAYGLTYLRIFVLVALGTIAVLLAGVAVKVVSERFSFFRYGAAVIGVIYTCFALCNIDASIARYNIAHRAEIKLDGWYLSDLSTDAAGVIADYIENDAKNFDIEMSRTGFPQADFYSNERWAERYVHYNRAAGDGMTARSFNLSMYKAGKRLSSITRSIHRNEGGSPA